MIAWLQSWVFPFLPALAPLGLVVPFIWRFFVKHWRAIDRQEMPSEDSEQAEKPAPAASLGPIGPYPRWFVALVIASIAAVAVYAALGPMVRYRMVVLAAPLAISVWLGRQFVRGLPRARPFPWQLVVILCTVAVALSLYVYFSTDAVLRKYVDIARGDEHWRITRVAWQTGWRVGCCLVLPLVTIALMPGERIRDYYVSLRGLARHVQLYIGVLAAVVLAALALLQTDSLYRPYPFALFAELPRAHFVACLAMYGLQFIALEFMFRAYMLRGLGRAIGSKAIWVMAIPYCMIHFEQGAPFAEGIGALWAALVLGTLAMRTGTLWGVALVHAGVAVLSVPIGPAFLPLLVLAPFVWKPLVRQWRIIDSELLETAPTNALARDKGKPKSKGKGKSKRKGKSKAKPRAPEAKRGFQWSPAWTFAVVIVTASISLALQEHYGERTYFYKWIGSTTGDDYVHLKAYAWWSGWRVFGYVILPMIAISLMPGERIRDYYVSTTGFFKHLWIYIGLFAFILPFVIAASQTDSFARTYPFYKLSNRSSFDFWAWQALYWIQFLSLEFFFRGYLLRGLSRVIGSKAILVMIVPYCMIHFGKPFPETIGAILAGLALGTLAMRTKSIWGGVCIHVGVAFTMDFLALAQCPSWEDTGMTCKGKY